MAQISFPNTPEELKSRIDDAKSKEELISIVTG